MDHLSELKWLKSEGCPLHERNTCKFAAYKGHVRVLKWLRNEKIPWDEWTCMFAAEGGHLEVLKYMHSQGCPLNIEMVRFRAGGQVLEWLSTLASLLQTFISFWNPFSSYLIKHFCAVGYFRSRLSNKIIVAAKQIH